ncbi:MAG: NAD-dependent epimerase/dehydratase family protein [Microbacterium arborescens]
MRRVLLLGGTGWVGRMVAERLVGEGADVTCLARGESGGIADGARLVRADRRRQGAYDGVPGEWDEVVEVAYEPDLVASALDALADRAAHWTLVSSVSVYASNADAGADESAAVVAPVDLEQYPDAKVAAEQITAERLGDRLLIARPGLIVGEGDPSDRFGYWAARFSRPGPVLMPTIADRFAQVIDVADLAEWIALAGARAVVGTMNAVGEEQPLGAVLREVAEAAGFDGETVEVDDETLLERDVRYWAGPRSLPLRLPHADAGFARRAGARFRDAGGRLSPLRKTILRVLADERDRGVERPRRSGLTAAEERAVLDAVS